MRVSPGEYERVRREPTPFFVLPGHEMPDVEDLVERHETYLVVEKREEPEQQVSDADSV
jgi:hypothetical protein